MQNNSKQPVKRSIFVRRLFLVIALIVLFVAVTAVVIRITVSVPLVQRVLVSQIQRALSDRIGNVVGIGSIQSDLWSFVSVNGVIVSDSGISQPLLKAEKISVRYLLPEMLRGRFTIRSVIVSGLVLDITRGSSGTLHSVTGFGGSRVAGRSVSAQLPVAIKSIRIRNGDIRYYDSLRQSGVMLNDADLILRPLTSDSAAVKVICRRGFIKTPMLADSFDRIELRGDISASGIRLDEAVVSVNGLGVTASGVLPFKPDVSWHAAIEAVDSASVLHGLYKRIPRLTGIGRATLKARITGKAENPDIAGNINVVNLVLDTVAIDTASAEFNKSGDSITVAADVRSRHYGVLSIKGALLADSLLHRPTVRSYRADICLADASVEQWAPRWGVVLPAGHRYSGSITMRAVGGSLNTIPDSVSVGASFNPPGSLVMEPAYISLTGVLNRGLWQAGCRFGSNILDASGRFTAQSGVEGMYSFRVTSPGIVCEIIPDLHTYADVTGNVQSSGKFSVGKGATASILGSVEGSLFRRSVAVEKVAALVEYRDRRLYLVKGGASATGDCRDLPLAQPECGVSGPFTVTLTASGDVRHPKIRGTASWTDPVVCSKKVADFISGEFIYDGSADSLLLRDLSASRNDVRIAGDAAIKTAPFSLSAHITDPDSGGIISIRLNRAATSGDSIAGSVDGKGIQISRIPQWLNTYAALRLNGRVNGGVVVAGTANNPVMKGSAFVEKPGIYGVTLHRMALNSFLLHDQIVRGKGVLNVASSECDLHGSFVIPLNQGKTLQITPSEPAQVRVWTAGMRLEPVFERVPGAIGVQGSCDGNISAIQDTARNWNLKGMMSISCDTVARNALQFRISDLTSSVHIGGTVIDPVLKIDAMADSVTVGNRRFSNARLMSQILRTKVVVDSLTAVAGSGRLRLDGAIGYGFHEKHLQISRPIRLGYEIRSLDMGLFGGLNGVTFTAGSVDGNGTAIIDSNSLQLDGGVDVSAAVVVSERFAPPIGPFDFSGSFHGDSIGIISLKGVWGKGTFNGAGSFVLPPDLPARADFDFNGKNLGITVGPAEDIKVFFDSVDLHLGNSGKNLILSGMLKAGKSRYKKKFSVITRFVTALLGKPNVQSSHSKVSRSLLDEIGLKVQVNTPPVLDVQLGIAEAALGADAVVCGTLRSPVFTGTVNVERGNLSYLGRKFIITKGAFRQTDCSRLNPDLDLTAEAVVFPAGGVHRANKYKVTMQITGTLEMPELVLSAVTMNQNSEPLSQVDIISLLMLGRIRNNSSEVLMFEDQTDFTNMLSERARVVASQEITGYATRQLERLLNLDNVSFEGNIFRVKESRVTVSKSIQDRISISYQGKIGSEKDQNVRISYKLTPVLYVDGDADVEGKYGLDLRFRWKF